MAGDGPSKQINVRIPTGRADLLGRVADQTGSSVAGLITESIEAHLPTLLSRLEAEARLETQQLVRDKLKRRVDLIMKAIGELEALAAQGVEPARLREIAQWLGEAIA
jgi:predicted DNA-binding protein